MTFRSDMARGFTIIEDTREQMADASHSALLDVIGVVEPVDVDRVMFLAHLYAGRRKWFVAKFG